ncbi:putative necrosis-inducing factor-domain-containing protein [Podospora fimiseda]|uniref:Necrosis-inducing factor-domain-containing protein n=1 Tax=Podospora fimiseda TaxID=252190 RepID=A0AAN6YKT0_9PEZI|nr:putative necrosis-inducing factor-domain-containing protein [Podospora fimiseda]
MQISTLILALAAFLTPLTLAGPVVDDPLNGLKSIPEEANIGRCSNITHMRGETTPGSPLVDDCIEMVNQIFFHKFWERKEGTHTLVEYKTCKFVVRNTLQRWSYFIGEADIRKAVVEAIEKHGDKEGAENRRVGATGYMNCGGPDIRWYIHHT